MEVGILDNQMMLNMFRSMIEKMSNEDLEKTLIQAKSFLGPQDYETLKSLIYEKRKK